MNSLKDDKRDLKCLKEQIWVPRLGETRKLILKEAHNSRYSIHPGTKKMYRDLRQTYWWPDMKNDIAYFIER